MTREEWLNNLVQLMAPKFEELGKPLPEKLHVACGFPGSGARGRTIGQCWYDTASADEYVEIFIRPDRWYSMDVAQILCHELVHAALGAGHGHGKEFKKLATKFGLQPPMKATTAGREFVRWARPMIDQLGKYPHSKMLLKQSPGRRQTTNPHVNLRCPLCDFYAKTTREMMSLGRLKCPVCPDQVLMTKEERGE